MNETTKFTEDVVIAQFRFSLIAPVIQGLYPDASATAYFKRITEKPIRLPNGCAYQYSYKTVEKWATLNWLLLLSSLHRSASVRSSDLSKRMT